MASAEMAQDVAELTAADEAILRTVAYASLFSYPLTVDELTERMMSLPLAREQVLARLRGPALRARLEVAVGRVFPAGRRAWLDDQARRHRHAQELLERHARALRLVQRFPWVRLVAVSGGCAHDNATDDDVDLFLVVRRGRLWSVCLALMVAARMLGVRRTLCVNYLVDESALALPERDVFTAAEIVGLRPLAGPATYAAFLEANRWASETFPGFFARAPREPLPEAGSPRRERLLDTLGAALFEPLARLALGWHLGRRLGPAPGVRLEAHRLKLHAVDHRPGLLERYRDALQELRP